MRLYILRPIEPHESWYDKVFGFVIRADNEEEARNFAVEHAGDEDRARYHDLYARERGVQEKVRLSFWQDSTKSTCEVLAHWGEPGIIIRDFASA